MDLIVTMDEATGPDPALTQDQLSTGGRDTSEPTPPKMLNAALSGRPHPASRLSHARHPRRPRPRGAGPHTERRRRSPKPHSPRRPSVSSPHAVTDGEPPGIRTPGIRITQPHPPPPSSARPSPSSGSSSPSRASRPASRGLLEGDRLHSLPPTQRRVDLAIGDVRAEPAVLDHQRLLGQRVDAQLAQRRRGARRRWRVFGAREQLERLVQRDREDLLLGLQRAELVALLHIRAVAPGGGEHLLAVRRRRRPPAAATAARSASLERERLRRLRRAAATTFLSPLDTYGPYRPDLSTTGSPVSGCSPSLRSPPPPRNSSSTFSGVSSSGASPRHRRPVTASRPRPRAGVAGHVRCRYGPYRPTRTTTSRPSSSRNSGIELMPARVDLAELLGDHPLQPARARRPSPRRRCLSAEVERRRKSTAACVAVGDLVELVLHRRGEVVVDQAREVPLQQPDHGERQERRDQRLAPLEDVPAVLDRLHDRRVRRRPPDAQLLHRLDQRRLGVAGRRLGVCARPRPAPRRSAAGP